MTILDDILETKRHEVDRLLSAGEIIQGTAISRPLLFDALYKADQLCIIAEMKRASPSKGPIAEGVNPIEQALQYVDAGATCISVLTDTPFFKGSFDDLAAVAKVVPVPILCKDFIIHPVQIDRAKQAGASVILLIVAALSEVELMKLYTYAVQLGLEVLVEVHDNEELDRAFAVGANIIGVNNRDLRTFEVDIARTEEIASIFPFDEKRVLISESGIVNREDALRVANAGAKAVLVGESLMTSGNVRNTMRSLQLDLTGTAR
ncbi:indole-3-glycerol phosphate synthase TrpC [Filibacter tadaridae]|uniref:Indole-3-glycerol phosphate synthase n=1 Tax=Filibacter tadaridae TaxID=2483811 RepID=A0A3P5WSQ0_9BACL|nr:indole-3-glycerol phosphate synthase TrpC [Filibacter tadaridae]VDC21636.1 Indole-3-glycerol phosphate synthase [Filibacter tadaridae]